MGVELDKILFADDIFQYPAATPEKHPPMSMIFPAFLIH